MDLFFRRASNPWGQEILLGVSWDLLWLFVAAGGAAIIVHVLFRLLWAPQLAEESAPAPPAGGHREDNRDGGDGELRTRAGDTP